MKKQVFLLFMGIIYSTTQYAQITATNIQMHRGSATNHIIHFEDEDENYIYLTKRLQDGLGIIKRDKTNFREIYAVEVDLEKNCTYKGVKCNNGMVDIFYQVFDKKQRLVKLFVKTVDEKGKVFQTKEISQIVSTKKGVGGYKMRLSPDKQLILLQKVYPDNETGKEIVGLEVLNESHKLLWKKDYPMDYEDERFFIQEISIDNSGDAFAEGVFRYEKDKKLRQSAKKSIFYKFTNDGFEKILPDSTAHYIPKLTIKILDDAWIAYGWIEDKEEENLQKGLAVYIIDKNHFEFTNQNLLIFDEALKKNLKEETHYLKKRKEFTHFELKVIDTLPDNRGYFIIAEEFFETLYTAHGMRTITRHAREILILRLDNDGKVVQEKIIDKDQVTTSSEKAEFFSFAYSIDKNSTIHIFFNDDPRNEENYQNKSESKVMDRIDNMIFVHYQIDSTGNTEYEVLDLGSRVKLLPRHANTLMDNSIYIYSLDGKRFIPTAITFQ